LARRLRDAPATAEALLIALSGYGQPADRERSADAGFAQHLVKPPDVARLAEILAEGRWQNPRSAAHDRR
jgi:CheY-like chemotaxis protein